MKKVMFSAIIILFIHNILFRSGHRSAWWEERSEDKKVVSRRSGITSLDGGAVCDS